MGYDISIIIIVSTNTTNTTSSSISSYRSSGGVSNKNVTIKWPVISVVVLFESHGEKLRNVFGREGARKPICVILGSRLSAETLNNC